MMHTNEKAKKKTPEGEPKTRENIQGVTMDKPPRPRVQKKDERKNSGKKTNSFFSGPYQNQHLGLETYMRNYHVKSHALVQARVFSNKPEENNNKGT